MGLLDKIKNLFLEDEIEEDEIELEEENKKVYQEPKDILPKVMRETIKKEEEETLKFAELKKPKSVKEEVKVKEEIQPKEEVPQRRFSFPIDFEEEITPSRVTPQINKPVSSNNNQNVLKTEKEVQVTKKVSELYTKKEITTKPKVKPTPVISPVYGVLDKNYKKEEVVERDEEKVEMKRPSKKVDFETVRKKAFGNLTDDIKDNLMCENCELYKEVKRISSMTSDGLLYDMMVDEEIKSDENISLEKAYDNYEDFGVAYEPKRETPKIENNTTIINNNTEVHISSEIEIEDKSVDNSVEIENDNVEHISMDEELSKIPSREEKKKEKSVVDDDFFELIDSMYKERIDG